jgi:uncharacterized radical SAM superfamily Fe-S cluster-containing enzyme
MMLMRFCNGKRIIKHNNRVIINYKYNGQWIKLNLQCYQMIEDAVLNNKSKEEFLTDLCDDEDKNYMRKLFERMVNLELLFCDSNEIEDNNIFNVTIALNSKCNLNCKHCCVDANETNIDNQFDIMVKRLDKIITCKPKSIVLTGGEPLYYSEFVRVVNYI